MELKFVTATSRSAVVELTESGNFIQKSRMKST